MPHRLLDQCIAESSQGLNSELSHLQAPLIILIHMPFHSVFLTLTSPFQHIVFWQSYNILIPFLSVKEIG